MAHSQTWIPKHVFRPPSPPVKNKLNVGYVSNDIKYMGLVMRPFSRAHDYAYSDHPLSHLMQSVFKFHDRDQFNIYLYATSPWDGTEYRPQIASSVEYFRDVSTWSTQDIVKDIMRHNIHIRACTAFGCCVYLIFQHCCSDQSRWVYQRCSKRYIRCQALSCPDAVYGLRRYSVGGWVPR